MSKHGPSRSGIALITVLMSLALISIFITQLTYTSNIDITIAKKNQKRLQAYYLAHSAARMGLLRLHIYRELENLIAGPGAAIAGAIPKQVRPMVWSFPLPEFPLPSVETDPSKISSAPGKFISIIKGEGSKIPINLLDGEFHRMPPIVPDRATASTVAEDIRKQIQDLIEIREENDSKFREKFDRNTRTAYVDALKDWIDSDNNLTEGGDESNLYDRKPQPYKQRNNRLATINEISMVDLWDDDVFSYFKNEFSTMNLYPKVNCNTLSLDRLKAYSKNQLTQEGLAAIAKRRMEEPFSSLEECTNYIRTNPDIPGGGDFAFPESIQKYNNKDQRENVFIVEGSSSVGDARALIRLYVRIDEEAPPAPASGGSGGTGGNNDKPPKFQDVHVIRFEEGAPQ